MDASIFLAFRASISSVFVFSTQARAGHSVYVTATRERLQRTVGVIVCEPRVLRWFC